MGSMNFLLNTVFNLYLMLVLMRLWLQLTRADFYNPFSQFIVKCTHPVVAPLRRVIPAIGGLDLATLLLAYGVAVFKFIVLTLIASKGTAFFDVSYLLWGLLSLVKTAGNLLFWILIIRAVLSWVSQGQNPIEYLFYQLTEPLLAPIRRILPVMGGLDFSILILFIGLQFANYLMMDFVGPIWNQL